jgi:CMP-N,N'-diacetyllegionaminic acid synthase
MKPLIIIPARGNSKGLPGKNIKLLDGKPLILHTLEAAQQLFPNDRICVSTDSSEIAEAVNQNGYHVPFMRPGSLATDTSSTRSVVLHALDFYREQGLEMSDVILLQPTSPFRTSAHIEEALKLYSSDCEMVVSVKEASANPYFTLFEERSDGFLQKSKRSDALRRQDIPPVWEFNGAIYIFAVDLILEKEISTFDRIRKFVMDEYSSLDIDTELDWMVAEYIVTKRKESWKQ